VKVTLLVITEGAERPKNLITVRNTRSFAPLRMTKWCFAEVSFILLIWPLLDPKLSN
jgi:hypothetical protein